MKVPKRSAARYCARVKVVITDFSSTRKMNEEKIPSPSSMLCWNAILSTLKRKVVTFTSQILDSRTKNKILCTEKNGAELGLES